MNIVLGASGHVGEATARALLRRKEPVTAVLHASQHVELWETAGAETAIVDVLDTEDLRAVGAAIVAASTCGARPGREIGDLGVLHEMETALCAQPIPAKILHAALYFTNWAPSFATVQKDGKLPSFFPVDFVLPMVAPDDIGEVAARLLRAEPSRARVFVEGPARHTPADVAAALAEALNQPVALDATPRVQWRAAPAKMGFSEPAARSFAGMTAAAMDPYEIPPDAVRGPTSLRQFVRELVAGTSIGA